MSTANVTKENPFGGAPGEEAIDALWVILSTFIIFTMQSGFGLLESGMVSRKSEANVMVKNMLDIVLGGIAYWFLGYGFSFGENTSDGSRMSGNDDFVLDGSIDKGFTFAKFFFQLSFAATATTIVSGAVAERMSLKSYMIFAMVNTGFIYAFPAHWMWDDNGWLKEDGALDFAGSSVVHMSGGIAALAGIIILGPRLGKFEKEEEKKIKYEVSSNSNVILGTFFLWWGWIGFNAGSNFAMSGESWKTASRVAIVTMNGAMAGGTGAVIMSAILHYIKKRKQLVDIPEFSSGVLGGLVAITAPANVIHPSEALFIGLVGGLIAIGAIYALKKLKLDDPVGCFGVHYAAGFWGMIATAFFAEDYGDVDTAGIFRGGNGKLLGWNLLACIMISIWSGGLSFLLFIGLKRSIGIRLDPLAETSGSDEVEHNITSDNSDVGKVKSLQQRKRVGLGKSVIRSQRKVNTADD